MPRHNGVQLMTDWERAACAGQDPGLFFDYEDHRGFHQVRALAAARQVCDRCTIRRACLDFAIASQQAFGVWGGLTAKERALMSHGRRAERPPFGAIAS